jgi:hypothetical protein
VGAEGPTGPRGFQGPEGDQGLTGLSAYQVAQTNGFTGTESQWLDSLVGESVGYADGGRADSVYGGVNPLVGGNASTF